MKITIRITNAYSRPHPRVALDVHPAPPEPPPAAAPPPKQKSNGGKKTPEAAAEAAAAAVAKELKRLRSAAAKPAEFARPAPFPAVIGAPASAVSSFAAEKNPAPAATVPAAARAAEILSAPDFGLEDEPGLSAIQTRFKILIVDDDPIIARLLTHFLSKSNYDVKSVTEGMEGLKIVFAEKPDLILLDVMMPGMDGFRFLELLKKGKRFANVPVLMISALVEEDQVLRALEAGATDYIVKPFSSRIVLAKVHKALKDLL
ncbi:MAG: response regulator [Candidatus Aminicenantes bacterium]|nr:response regulator [Candidatus Aminicenantes bacterium]